MTDINIKLIITDLDNTLLRDDKSISEYTVKVMEKCKKKGILIIFATARPERGAKDLDIMPDGIISNNGALVSYNEEIIYKKEIPYSICKEIIKKFTNDKEIIGITVEDNNVLYTNCNKEEFEELPNYWKPVFTDFNKVPQADIYKMAIHTENKDAIVNIIKKYKECHIISSSGEDWHILTHENATKFNAVRSLINFLDIDMQNVIAFGDNFNDIEMVKNCGIGVAMLNAVKELKDVSDYIARTNNDDGVAKFLDTVLG